MNEFWRKNSAEAGRNAAAAGAGAGIGYMAAAASPYAAVGWVGGGAAGGSAAGPIGAAIGALTGLAAYGVYRGFKAANRRKEEE